MKKIAFSLMGFFTVLALVFGSHSSTIDKNENMSRATYSLSAHGDYGG